ncbi:MAG: hypothetical protein EXS36_12235 [Pedosphaera sp.]|nr:hypothetical protein [Pedosphaera sp.]
MEGRAILTCPFIRSLYPLAYNGLDDVDVRTAGGVNTRLFHHYALNLAPIVAERTGGAFMRYYAWTPNGRLLYMIDASNGNAVSYFHFDRVGSTLALTSSAGAVTDAYAYSPYGVLPSRTGTSTQPFTFVGAFGIRSEGSLYQRFNNMSLYPLYPCKDGKNNCRCAQHSDQSPPSDGSVWSLHCKQV